MTRPSLDWYRRQAKSLKKRVAARDAEALARASAVTGTQDRFTHSAALHVIAAEAGYASWPKLKLSFDLEAMDRSARADRLKVALYFGQHWVVEALLAETPDLARGDFGLSCALYDAVAVSEALKRDPDIVHQTFGIRSPMCHLCFSQHIHGAGTEEDMMTVAQALLAAGASVDDHYNYNGDANAPLSVLYGALGHANNMVLARWLLENGANPNDGESLYHATELGHREGLKILLEFGADPKGTNALPRALDFNDHKAVRLLLKAGADPNEGIAEHISGEPSFVVPALHQAARRMCDAEMVSLLLNAGADPSKPYRDVTPYAMARIYGNAEAASLIASAGGITRLSTPEDLLVRAADGAETAGQRVDTSALQNEIKGLIGTLIGQPNRLEHVKRLVAVGLDPDRPDPMGVTPVQISGWEGLPKMLAYFLSLSPDLSHTNNYGGGLIGTIIHGSENCPSRSERDHIACLKLALEAGVKLQSEELRYAGNEEVNAFLADWAASHPQSVI